MSITQSETLKIGQRGEYIPKGITLSRCEKLNIKCWVEKRKHTPDEFEKNLRTFVDIPVDYRLVYGITWNGKDYDCGDVPRDMGYVIKGVAIANNL